jgi:tetratricopeptide (TPR) repeat protein
MASMFGKLPDVPLRLVAVRRGGGFATAGTALVDEAVFRRPKIDSLTAMNIAEAAAKLYLGNAIPISGEGYGVVGEGLSRYAATQFIESKFGKDVADVERMRQRNAYLAVSKRDAPMSTVSPIDDYYYPVVANKGAMAWRIIARRLGPAEFANIIKSSSQDGALNLGEIRQAVSPQKALTDQLFDQVTEMNLMAGLPRQGTGETLVALRNTGTSEVSVEVAATTASGQRLVTPVTIAANNFGEAAFKTADKIVRVEVDAEKLYPQTDYSDDVAPRETTDSDPVLAAKRNFDKQEYAVAETLSRNLLRDYPRFDDLRIILGRALLAQGKSAEAEREFKAVLDEKLPTARSVAWANVGLAETAAKASQNEAAIRYAEIAIALDAEYGAGFAARNLRNRISVAAPNDPIIKAFFADFDKAASANRKADLEALAVPGEVAKFVNGIAGSTEQWQTTIRQIDRVDANTVLVETSLAIKLLNKDAEAGIAVFRLTKSGNSWKLSAVDMFEVR